MTQPRTQHAASLANGKVLIAGGTDGGSSGLPAAHAELYDPANGSFTATGSMTTWRYGLTATSLQNGKVLVAGGEGGGAATADLYDPAAGTFAATGRMSVARYFHTATLLSSGMVLVAGGSNGGIGLASAELYNPATGTFATTGSMAGKSTITWRHRYPVAWR